MAAVSVKRSMSLSLKCSTDGIKAKGEIQFGVIYVGLKGKS